MSETKSLGSEAGMENPETNQEIKLACRILFDERGELSPLRCAIFSCKVGLWLCFLLDIAMIALLTLLILSLRTLYS